MKISLLSVALVSAVLLSQSASAAAPEMAFAQRVAAKFRTAFPGRRVEVANALTIHLWASSQNSADDVQINLDRVWQFCQRVEDQCEREVNELVAKAQAVSPAMLSNSSIEALRAVVRSELYLVSMRQQIPGEAGDAVAGSIAGHVIAVCVFDMPTAMRAVSMADVAKLRLSRARTLQLCKAKMRSQLPPLSSIDPPRPGVVGELSGDPYESSYILFPEDWRPLSKKLRGDLLVSVPDASVVLYTDDSDERGTNELYKRTQEAFDNAERQVSPEIFRLTANGWKVAKLAGEGDSPAAGPVQPPP